MNNEETILFPIENKTVKNSELTISISNFLS